MSVSAVQEIEKKEIEEYKTIFLQSLREVIPSLRLYNDAMLAGKIGKEKVIDLSLEVCGYCIAGVEGSLSRNELTALVCQVLRCLSRYMTGTLQIPVTLNTVIKEIGLLEYSVEQSFPSYAQAKLLRYAISPVRA